ncbi:MAG: exosortase/archaeosortase family protein [Bryobacteraceae bacterium]
MSTSKAKMNRFLIGRSLEPSPLVLRLWGFLLIWFLSLLLFRVPLTSVISLALRDERYSYVLLVPFITLWMIWENRDHTFLAPRYRPGIGIPILVSGILSANLSQNLFVSISAIVLVWIAVFILLFGLSSFQHIIFPLIFLFLIAPLPFSLMDKAVIALQKGSADVAFTLFKAAGVPVFRDGFQFSLPGIVIEIAEECSGIRSSTSLLISSFLAGHLFLRSNWRKAWLILLTIPIVIFKNAVRIVTLSLLAAYVDRGFLFGNLHKHGGLPFSLIALSLMALVLLALRKTERNSKTLS